VEDIPLFFLSSKPTEPSLQYPKTCLQVLPDASSSLSLLSGNSASARVSDGVSPEKVYPNIPIIIVVVDGSIASLTYK